MSRRQPSVTVITKRTRRQPSHRGSRNQEKDFNEAMRRSSQRLKTSEPGDDNTNTTAQNFGEPVHSRVKVSDASAQSLSHDGSSSDHDSSRHTSALRLNSTSYTGAEEGYYKTKVPNDVDFRASYGRRKTKDFGYPGARIKLRSNTKTCKTPLAEPGNWIKRSCGHFSTIYAIESREAASEKPCRQCREKHGFLDPIASKHQPTHKQTTTDLSTLSSQRNPQHHSQCMPSDQCGDAFAQDLSHVIDSILVEHANTLQHVIDNIKFSQPNLAQLRRMSKDLVQRSKNASTNDTSCHNIHPSAPRQHVCRSCQSSCRSGQPVQKVCEWQLPCPYVPPKIAQKLNVGSPGQLGPNLNDDRAKLQQSIKSVSDMINLIKSAADDFDVDLDKKPTVVDDEMFEQAPTEGPPQQFVSTMSRSSTTLEIIEDKAEHHTQDSENSWLQKTRRQLTELSEARSRMLDELDSIAEDLSVHLDECQSSLVLDPVQHVFSKAPRDVHHKSPHLQNKSVNSVADEIPRMSDYEVNEKRLSRVPTPELE
jgi:hypothetical protein